MSKNRVSCGVVVTDGSRLLIGHSTGNRHWDIPKGMADPGETELVAAVRELQEETGLVVPADDLIPLGRKPYRKGKDLALYLLYLDPLPDCTDIRCTSMVNLPGRQPFPELDEFRLVRFDELERYAGAGLAARLAEDRTIIADICRVAGSNRLAT